MQMVEWATLGEMSGRKDSKQGHKALVSELLELECQANLTTTKVPLPDGGTTKSLSDGETGCKSPPLMKEKCYDSDTDLQVHLKVSVERRGLWDSLKTICMEGPCMVMVDFNIIRDDRERVGGNPRPLNSMDEFNECLDSCGLLDLAVEGFKPFVEVIWLEPVQSSGFYKLAEKLRKVKIALRTWNRKLDIWEHREETRMSQLAKKKLLKEGDQNTSFFHASVNQKRKKLLSQMVLEDGSVFETPEIIHEGETTYFQNFLSMPNMVTQGNLSSLIDADISQEENIELVWVPSCEEVAEALANIPKDSTPGPDDFGSTFYTHCWDFIKEDLVEAAEEFFLGNPVPHFYPASYIVLIPKVEDPRSFDKFRPISLCSAAYKIFSKILVKRLTHFLPRLISSEQGTFIPGRSIFENITLAQEMVHSLNKKVIGGNVMLKIDMAKAYDQVDWSFLEIVLHSFGFSPPVCSLVMNCVRSPWFSIMMNGTYKGFFQPVRGLRQGDPLSPYLFIIMEDVLSLLLKKEFVDGQIRCFSHPVGAPLVSHLLYADDLLIFANDSIWTSFFRAKYLRTGHVMLAETRPTASRFWRSIVSVIPEVVGNVAVKVRNGESSFWFDKWLVDGPLCSRYEVINVGIKIQDVWLNGSWDEDKLVDLIGLEQAGEITRKIIVGREGSNILIWKPAVDGCFSTNSAWNLLRIRGVERLELDWVWHQLLPKKISMCMWKARFGALPVGVRIQAIDIPMVSRCDCCVLREVETVDHVLRLDSIAMQVWNMASIALGISCMEGRSWWKLFKGGWDMPKSPAIEEYFLACYRPSSLGDYD
ncbi:hypothetical protein F2P56_013012 [Juglans regia]|uniref:Uncharacterized protein LOC108997535 n=2 Tax=Juglans regia TaxID=51240 RepID=A0A2I4FCM2_JUGRE|nr:uncharacterized protein LOC108997535 [Juglans regia]KAF5468901.1 hypothetical protein F2P56_013012 [Juglans regia]